MSDRIRMPVVPRTEAGAYGLGKRDHNASVPASPHWYWMDPEDAPLRAAYRRGWTDAARRALSTTGDDR